MYVLSCKDIDNKLEESLFCLLASTEMIVVTRGISIILIHISNLLWWLVANTYKLVKYNWSLRPMSKVYNNLELGLEMILTDSIRFLN